eukprot:7606702-Pyramimonas_sp.AAC.1
MSVSSPRRFRRARALECHLRHVAVLEPPMLGLVGLSCYTLAFVCLERHLHHVTVLEPLVGAGEVLPEEGVADADDDVLRPGVHKLLELINAVQLTRLGLELRASLLENVVGLHVAVPPHLRQLLHAAGQLGVLVAKAARRQTDVARGLQELRHLVAHHTLEADEYGAVGQRNTVQSVAHWRRRNTVQSIRGIQCSESKEYSAVGQRNTVQSVKGIQCSRSEGYSVVSQRDTVQFVRGIQCSESKEYSAISQRNIVQSVAHNALEAEKYSAVIQRNTVQSVRIIQCNQSEEYSAVSQRNTV